MGSEKENYRKCLTCGGEESNENKFKSNYCYCEKCFELNPIKKKWELKNLKNLKKEGGRKNKENRAVHILVDSRNRDKKFGQLNDLTLEFIQEKISQPCEYCGETDLDVTLDRVDNSKGHSQDNVKPACIRCNYIKVNMPIEAWLHMIPVIKEAKLKLLFENWRCADNSEKEWNLIRKEKREKNNPKPPKIIRPKRQIVEKIETICPECNCKFYLYPYKFKLREKHYCSISCSNKNREQFNWPSKEELEKLVLEKSIIKISKELGVSNSAIKKHCKKVGIKTPEAGYWNKVYAGKIEQKTP